MNTIAEPTYGTATFFEWYQALCRYAREHGGSTSTEQAWMHYAYNRGETPSEAWEDFNK